MTNRLHTFWTYFDLELIEFAKQHPILYGKDKVRNVKERKKVWLAFADDHNKSIEEVMKRWKTINDSYRKFVKNPSALPRTSKYCDGRLSFLGKPLGKVDQSAQANEEDLGETSSASTSASPTVSTIEQTLMTEKIFEEFVKWENQTTETGHTSATVTVPEAELDNETLEEDSNMEISTTTDEVLSTSSNNAAETESESDNSDDFVLSKLKERYQNKTALSDVRSKMVEQRELLKANLSISSEANPSETYFVDMLYFQEHSTIEFYEQIGKYVEANYPVDKQKEYRSKIWAMINEEELKMLQEE